MTNEEFEEYCRKEAEKAELEDLKYKEILEHDVRRFANAAKACLQALLDTYEDEKRLQEEIKEQDNNLSQRKE